MKSDAEVWKEKFVMVGVENSLQKQKASFRRKLRSTVSLKQLVFILKKCPLLKVKSSCISADEIVLEHCKVMESDCKQIQLYTKAAIQLHSSI
jgi:hypothetical protein